MTTEELVVMTEWLEENRKTGCIYQSSPPFTAPWSFAQKPDVRLQFYIDYRDINGGMIKHWYPLSSLRETLNVLAEAKIYTKLDVQVAYNLDTVKEGDDYELAF